MLKTGLCFVFLFMVAAAAADENCFNKSKGKLGRCVNLKECASAQRDLKFKIYPQVCSFNGTIPDVCCLEEEVPGRTELLELLATHGCPPLTGINTPPPALKQGHKAWEKCVQYQSQAVFPCVDEEKVLDDHCSYDHGDDDRIVGGGVDADAGEYPHMALLGYGKTLEVAKFLCGGSLISEKFILTAGHCISSQELGSVKYAAFGVYTRKTKPLPHNTYGIKTIIKHPEYKPPSKYHDIALLETDREIKFNARVIPACLHVGDDVDDGIAFASGWGALGHRKENADILQNVPLWKTPHEVCRWQFPPHRHLAHGYNGTTQMCYGDDGIIRDTCSGDSGGPVQIKSRSIYCMYLILGVTSFGYANCAQVGVPGIYTRVSYYVPWIESVVWP